MTYSQEPSLFFILDEIVESWSSQMKNFGATAAMYNEEPFLDLTNNQELKCRTIELGLQDSGLSGACLYISFFHNASNEWEVGTIELLPTPDQDHIKKTAVLKMLEYFSEKFKEALPGGWVYSFAGQTVKFLKAWVSWRNKHQETFLTLDRELRYSCGLFSSSKYSYAFDEKFWTKACFSVESKTFYLKFPLVEDFDGYSADWIISDNSFVAQGLNIVQRSAISNMPSACIECVPGIIEDIFTP